MPALPGRRVRACFVTPWYGEGIPGGAEAEVRHTARNLAAAGVEVTVLTTCLGGPGADGDFERFARGETREQGVRVVRFTTTKPQRGRFALLNARAMAGEPLSDQEESDFFTGMAHSPALLAHLAAHPELGPFFFIPYLFATSVLGALVHPARSVLIPCLHDEGYARLKAVRRAFERVRAVAFHVPAERDLAAALYDSASEAVLVGEGVDTGWSADAGRFRRSYGQDGPLLLYAGRKDAGKSTPLLVRYFLRYLADRGGAAGLKLVLIGPGSVVIPAGGAGKVLDLGYLDPQDKYDAYAAADVFVQPSLLESFSIVVMESWLAGTPVLVRSGCAVTRGHVEAACGGLHFDDYPHFAECLDRLLARPELRHRLAAAGREYVLANFAWPPVTERYLRLIERIAGESAPAPVEAAGRETVPAALSGRPESGSRVPGGPAVHQMLPDFAVGDAIGNEVLALQKALRSWGVRSEIFAAHFEPRLRELVRPVEEYPPQAGPDDVLIFHFSIGHRLADELPALIGRKVLRYHNITPAPFLEGVYPDAAERARLGRRQLPGLALAVEIGLGVSAFNCAELTAAGCAVVEEVPILLDLSVLETGPDPRLLARFGDGRPTVLHVGRLVPNKRIEDLIKTHHWLTRALPMARLLVVGGGETNPYAQGVRRLTRELGVPAVYFTGHVSNAALSAYYRSADVYLCLSEHEGFCVPLVEAMYFGLPIVARAAAGVPGTLGSGGILVPGTNPVSTAAVLARVLGDTPLRASLGERSRARLEAFRPAAVQERLRQVLRTRLGLGLG